MTGPPRPFIEFRTTPPALRALWKCGDLPACPENFRGSRVVFGVAALPSFVLFVVSPP